MALTKGRMLEEDEEHEQEMELAQQLEQELEQEQECGRRRGRWRRYNRNVLYSVSQENHPLRPVVFPHFFTNT